MAPDYDALDGNRMTDDEIDSLLRDVGIGVLSMTLDGVPYGIPLSFGFEAPDRIYVVFVGHSDEGRKYSYATGPNPASFLAYDVRDVDEWRSVIVAGDLERVVESEWDAAREALADNAWYPQLFTEVDPFADPRAWKLVAESKDGRKVSPG